MQCTLLALLLFLVLVNDVGFDKQLNNAGDIASSKAKIKAANELHLKFVDDLTLAETVKTTNTPDWSSDKPLEKICIR